MKKLAIIVLVLSAAACEEQSKEISPAKACDTAHMSAFIIECATAANPKSDEEGEDLVEQCEETAVHLYCEGRCHIYNGRVLCK